MKLYLAESGGMWNSYFGGVGTIDLYLADSGGWFKKIEQERGRDETIPCGGAAHIETGGVSGEFDGVNILQSFYYADEFTEKVIIPRCKRFLLDSGAFTFFSRGGTVDWNDYVKRYAGFINQNKIDRFFELDIDVLVGYEKVLDVRHRIEELTGKPVIPVWHKSRGIDKYYKMCEQYDYVAIGGIVSKEIKRNEYRVFPKLILEAHKRGAMVHGLGFTNLKGMEIYKFDSVDSTTWTCGTRFGQLYTFNGKTLIQRKRPQGKRISVPKDVALHNWREWVKFSKYAETHL